VRGGVEVQEEEAGGGRGAFMEENSVSQVAKTGLRYDHRGDLTVDEKARPGERIIPNWEERFCERLLVCKGEGWRNIGKSLLLDRTSS